MPRRHHFGDSALPLAEVAHRLRVEADTGLLARAAERLPLRFPAEYLDALDEAGRLDVVRRIGWPDPEELDDDPGGLDDPVGERGESDAGVIVVRKYPDRVILLVTSRCHFYCRFCFRAGTHEDPSIDEVRTALAALAGDAPPSEVILSGGDPLVLTDEFLDETLRAARALRSVRTIRVHTRAPVHQPSRVTPELARVLAGPRGAPTTWVGLHVSHPAELTPPFERAVAQLAEVGLPLVSQTVLLAGVNDDADTLEELFGGLYARGVRPVYLHHPDRVPGTGRFRVSIERGRTLARRLRGRLPGPALPAYVLDLPDGRGKVPVEWLEACEGAQGIARYRVRRPDGSWSIYDDPASPLASSSE